VPLDKSKSGVKDKYPGGVFGTVFFAREVEDHDSGSLTLNHSAAERRSTNHRFDLSLSAMILLCEHPFSYGMRERPINVHGLVAPTRGTHGLLSMRTTSGYGFCVRSIQYSRTANLRAAATFATAFGF